MAVKSGIHQEYFSILDGRHDLLAEAEVTEVAGLLAEHPRMFGSTSLRVEKEVAGGADAVQEPAVRVYRLAGHAWTQVFCPVPSTKSFEIGKFVSERLATRCLQIEVTDDCWGGYALFDRNELKEISCFCMNCDLKPLSKRLGFPLPISDDDEIYDEGDFFYSELRYGNTDSDKLKGLTKHLDLWVDSGYPPQNAVERLDLLFPS